MSLKDFRRNVEYHTERDRVVRNNALEEAIEVVRDFGFVTNHEARNNLLEEIRALKDKP